MKAIWIKASGETKYVEPKNGKDFKLDELQGFVGGYIEVVDVLTGAPKGSIMIVNEEGKLKGLPYNGIASAMVGFLDAIVGDVLVCDREMVK